MTPDIFIFSFMPFSPACLLGKKDVFEINRALHSREFKYVVYSYSEAMEEHRRYLDSGKEDAFREAEEEAMKGERLNGEEWESLPNKYIGKCDKNCYGWRKMEKVEVVDFGVRGVYVCAVCGYAYPPLYMPGPRSGELVDKIHRIDK